MTKLLRVGLVALLGLAVATPAAVAGKVVATPEKGHMTVKDDAHVFDKDSVIRAESKFHGVTFKSPTHLTVVTFDKVPADKKADFDKAKGDATARRKFMKDWVHELAPVESERGVFVLVCQEARLLEVVADRQTDLKRHFGDADAKHVADVLTAGMKAASEGTKTEDEKRTVRGEALVKATDFVIGQLKNTSAPEPTGTAHTSGGAHESTRSTGMHWLWWVLIVVGVLLVIWIIVALIRAMTGNVYGGMYAGGGYGYGGGPGFFGCFMGGMFGAMAGMWMYNSMMGTHYAHDPSGAGAGEYGGDAGAADTGAGDYDNGAEAGGDWGDDAGGGGGDAGAGGDWGNDAGGGGGGGDWGGDGGGGDWGGDAGGGGDFGGGGGDW